MTADDVLDALQKYAPEDQTLLAAYYVTARALAMQGAFEDPEQLARDARAVVDEATPEEIQAIVGDGS